MSPSTTVADCIVCLTKEESELLQNILEDVYRTKQIEVHRTDALGYKRELEREEELLGSMVEKLRLLSDVTAELVAP